MTATLALGLLALTALVVAASAFRLPVRATSMFGGLAGLLFLSAELRTFLAFAIAFAFISAAKVVAHALGRPSDMADWKTSNFLYSAGPPVLAATLGAWMGGSTLWGFAALAGLSVVVADTAATEVGVAWGGKTILITSGRSVPAGTDGGISLTGSGASVLWSGTFAVAALLAMEGPHDPAASAWVASAGVAGSLLDSVLGASVQRRGWLSNEHVNGLTAVVAMIATALVYG